MRILRKRAAARAATVAAKNAPCPCGSGRLYKNCCRRKSTRTSVGIDWLLRFVLGVVGILGPIVGLTMVLKIYRFATGQADLCVTVNHSQVESCNVVYAWFRAGAQLVISLGWSWLAFRYLAWEVVKDFFARRGRHRE